MPFQRAVAEASSKLVISLWAREKRGKTHLALTFPEPIFIFNWDEGLDELLPKFRDKQIHRADYPLSAQATVDEYRAMFQTFLGDIQYIGNNRVPGGTIVFDTGSHLWQMIQKVDLDTIKAKRKSGEIFPFDYADANAHFSQIVQYVKRLDMNVVMLHRARALYDDKGNKTDRWEAQENGQVPYLVQHVLRLFTRDGQRFVLIESSRTKPELEGIELPGPDYGKLASFLL